VSLFLLSVICSAGSFVSAVCCCLLEVAMVTAINRKLAEWTTFAYLRRDIAVIFQRHRRLYPTSPLRVAFVASSCMLGSCIAGLIVIHRVAGGL
jgi:hypothetical protein